MRHTIEPIAWGGGFAALDDQVRSQARLWLSEDGHRWTSEQLPFRPTELGTQLVAFREGLVLARMSRMTLTGFRFDIWMSGDGKGWQQRGSVTTSAETPGYFAGGDLVALGNRLAVYAYIGPFGSGGASPGVVPGSSATLGTPAAAGAAVRLGGTAARSELGQWVWTSDDGRTWRKQRVRGVGTGDVGVAGSTDRGFFGILGNGTRSWLAGSPDGVRWKTIAPLPDKVQPDNVLQIVATTDGYVLAADTLEVGDCCQLTMWHVSPTGVFTQVLEQFHWELDGLAADGATVVLTSYRFRSLGGRTDALALVSRDGGTTFELSAGWPALQQTDCLGAIAVKEGTAVSEAGCEVLDGPALVVADLP